VPCPDPIAFPGFMVSSYSEMFLDLAVYRNWLLPRSSRTVQSDLPQFDLTMSPFIFGCEQGCALVATRGPSRHTDGVQSCRYHGAVRSDIVRRNTSEVVVNGLDCDVSSSLIRFYLGCKSFDSQRANDAFGLSRTAGRKLAQDATRRLRDDGLQPSDLRRHMKRLFGFSSILRCGREKC
jgi:hypothetical protein